MAGLKEQLAAKGYDVSNFDETSVLNQLKSKGYDTSQFTPSAPAPKPQEEQSLLQKTVETFKDPVNYIPGVLPVKLGMAALNKSQEGYNLMGEMANEKMTKMGVPPPVSAGISTGIQMIPDITNAVGGALEGRAALEGSNAGRFLSGPGRAEAGEAIGAAEKAVGIKTEIVPTLRRELESLGVKKGASSKDYINLLNDKLASGEPLTAQQLSEHHKMLTTLLSNEPSKVARTIFGAKSALGPSGQAQASILDSKIVQALNEAAPGRGEAAADYAAAMKRQKLYKGVGLAALSAAGGSKLKSILSSLTGH